jgi:hypothetical protein
METASSNIVVRPGDCGDCAIQTTPTVNVPSSHPSNEVKSLRHENVEEISNNKRARHDGNMQNYPLTHSIVTALEPASLHTTARYESSRGSTMNDGNASKGNQMERQILLPRVNGHDYVEKCSTTSENQNQIQSNPNVLNNCNNHDVRTKFHTNDHLLYEEVMGPFKFDPIKVPSPRHRHPRKHIPSRKDHQSRKV